MRLHLSASSWLSFWLTVVFLGGAANCGAYEPALRDYLKKSLAESHRFTDKYDAEVWLLDKSQRLEPFIKSGSKRLELLSAIHGAARATDLEPDLVLALIEVESSFRQFAISKSGAQGLMQVMPFWKNEIGRPSDNLTDITTNLQYGCYILRYYIDRHPDSLVNALAAYNGSLGKTWYAERVLTALDRWR